MAQALVKKYAIQPGRITDVTLNGVTYDVLWEQDTLNDGTVELWVCAIRIADHWHDAEEVLSSSFTDALTAQLKAEFKAEAEAAERDLWAA